ncbi:MAG: hypothetical protein PWQ72_670 [Pseudothermotoga sp.]|nr:hypothetical protein [Pseudothermotoga sp.]
MSSVGRQGSIRKKLFLWISLILVAFNYAAGVFVYRGYVKKLSETTVNCNIVFSQNLIRGEVNIIPPDRFKVMPLDYQIYFYDKRGNTLQLIANSLNGKMQASFETQSKDVLISSEWNVVGYSNVKIRWLWLSMSLAIPVEVNIK